MALSPTISVCLNAGCTTLTLSETTGTYDAVSNTGGYGAPNATTGAASAAVLVVTNPDGDTFTINLFTEGFPTTNSDHEYEIDLADIGDVSSIEDGLWTFDYTVTATAVDYTVNQGYLFYCNAACCVAKLLSNVEADECLCDDQNNKRIDTYIKAKTFLDSLINASYCYNITNFDKISAILTKLCRNADCKTCN